MDIIRYALQKKMYGGGNSGGGSGGETEKTTLGAYADGTLIEIKQSDLKGATKIKDYAFVESRITSIDIPETVTSIGQYAFNKSYLKSVKFPKNLTTLKRDAFNGCDMEEIIIPDNLEQIDYRCFLSCDKLKVVKIGEKVNYINSEAFLYDSAIEEVHIKSLEQWCNIQFGSDSSNPMYQNPSYLYINGEPLTDLVIPNTITKINNYSFVNSKITSATIPNSITSIGLYAFYMCKKITTITIPDSVTSIGHGAFSNCNLLATITMKPTTPPTIQSSTFNTSYVTKIIVPKGCLSAYQTATNWSTFADYMEEATE